MEFILRKRKTLIILVPHNLYEIKNFVVNEEENLVCFELTTQFFKFYTETTILITLMNVNAIT